MDAKKSKYLKKICSKVYFCMFHSNNMDIYMIEIKENGPFCISTKTRCCKKFDSTYS